MRRSGIVGITVLVAMLFAGAALAEGLRIAVVDVNKVLNESEEGKAAKKKMEARYAELKAIIDAKQGELKKLKEDLDKQKVMLGKEKLKEREEAFQAKILELRKITQDAEREMQGRQGESTREILKEIEVHIEAVVKAEKYDLVLERNAGVIHVAEPMDITGRILSMMNKGAGKASAPAGKAVAPGKREGGSGK